MSTVRWHPRTRFENLANYEARYSRTITRTDAVAGSGVTSTDAAGRLSGDTSFKNLAWRVDASQQSINYTFGRDTKADRLSAGLSFFLTPQLSIFGNAGREANNYVSLDKQSYVTRGLGIRWSPSERTKFSASRDYLFFGQGHNVSFDHRTARTGWRFRVFSTTPTHAQNSGMK